MNNQESEKSISDKTFPMDLASKPPPTKPMETSGLVKPPLASPLTLRHAVQPNMRVVTTVPTLSQHITAGSHLIPHIVPQVGIKQVDGSVRPHITTIPARPTTPVQVGQNATRTILSTTYQLPRGATTVSNIAGPRIRPPVVPSHCQTTIAGTGTSLAVGHVSTNSVGPIGVTVNVPVGFVRAAGPPRASSPAAGTAWIGGGTVQVQTVQVCSPSVVSQRIPTFATVGRSTQSSLQNPRQTLIHQSQVNAVKSVSAAGTTLSVQTMTTGSIPARTQQGQSTTLVYGGTVSHASRLHAIPAGNNSITQRVKGISSNTRQIQVSTTTPRGHITVPAAIGSRITAIPAANSTGGVCNNSINSPHIVSYANSVTQSQNISMPTTSCVSRVTVNNIAISRPIQGQVLTSGNRIATSISNSAITTTSSMPNTSTTNIITSTNINTNNLSLTPPNISGLVQLHPAAVLVASGATRTNNTKLLAQIAQPANIKTNGSNILQSTIQTISLNSTSGATLGLTSNISTVVTNVRTGSAVPTRIMTSVPKTFSQATESNANPFMHRSSPSGALGVQETKPTTNSFPLSGTPYYYNASYNASTNYSTNNTVPLSTHSVHVSQPVCFSPIMLVESSSNSTVNTSEQTNHTVTTPTQLSISTSIVQQTSQSAQSNSGITTQSVGTPSTIVHHGQVASAPSANQQNVKPTSSPRPSILRKRDHEGLHLKAAKNLTPALHVITNNPPVSPQQRPDSRGNCPSSTGSTTISATSSPGLEDQDDDNKYPLNLEVDTKYAPEENREKIVEDGVKYSGLNEENLRKFNLETKDQIFSIEERMKLNAPAERLHTGIRTNRDFNVLENRYKFENRLHPTNDSDKKINVSLIEGDAFKSNESNVKHEESNSRKNLRQDDDRPAEMSPRKKPRKQQLTTNESLETKGKTDDMTFISETHVKREQVNTQESSSERLKEVTVRKPPSASLLSYYKQSWKSTQYHFQRYSDVKPKDERKPNIIDLANQSHVLQKINGWKIYHLSTQMEDMSEMESQVYEKLSGLLKLMEKEEGFQTKKEILAVNELIKGNMQRSKIINDGMLDAKNQIMRIFDHKANVSDIIHRCASKRNFKKRDKS